MTRHLLSAVAGMIVAVGGVAPAMAQASEDTMARCQQLYGLWAKHNERSYNSVNGGAMALEHCRKGEYSVGVAQLKRALERQQVSVPPVESAAR